MLQGAPLDHFLWITSTEKIRTTVRRVLDKGKVSFALRSPQKKRDGGEPRELMNTQQAISAIKKKKKRKN